MNWHFSKLPKY